MSTEILLTSSILEREEKYLCLLYRKKTCNSVDGVRLPMFLKKYKQFSEKGSKNETILKIKNLDGSSWPPWSRVFVQKI